MTMHGPLNCAKKVGRYLRSYRLLFESVQPLIFRDSERNAPNPLSLFQSVRCHGIKSLQLGHHIYNRLPDSNVMLQGSMHNLGWENLGSRYNFFCVNRWFRQIFRFAKKMDCGSLPIHPTYLISHHPTSFCSVMSRNISKDGVSIIRGITRRTWWNGDRHLVGDFDCRVWTLDGETGMGV
jgi:hypothetical protein